MKKQLESNPFCHSEHTTHRPIRIAVFASGNGSNFQAIATQFKTAVALVFSDHHDAYVLKGAAHLGIKSVSIELKDCQNKEDYERKIVTLCEENEVSLIVLAGYMKIISKTLLDAYKGRIINIHPSYLPDFAGSPHAIEESHARQHGCGVTVHFVDEGVDTGEIIAQERLAYLPDLCAYEKSVHDLEHRLYPEVIGRFLK